MLKTIVLLLAFTSICAIANDEFNGQGFKSQQLLDGKVIATGNHCNVVNKNNRVKINHNAKIEGWDVSDIELEFNLNRARYSNGKYVQNIGTVGQGYCGDHRSARDLYHSLEKVGNKVILTTSYKCSAFSRTVQQHICFLY